MAMSIKDYLLEPNAVDWPEMAGDWKALVPEDYTFWLASRFADLFFVQPDESVWMLDVGSGSLERLAHNKDEFLDMLLEDGNADNWLAMPLVDDMVAAGHLLGRGECYGFKVPPVLGGPYDAENCAVLPIADYLSACATIHEQLRGVPDGTEVVLSVDNLPLAR